MYSLNNKIALLTKHGKVEQIAPVFSRHWQGIIEEYDAFDTDTLGSFDNSVERVLSPIECAIKKANLACEFTGLPQGLGSEGSFTGFAGIGNMNEEFLAFVDKTQNIEVVGVFRQMTNLASMRADCAEELTAFLNQYPSEQGWMLIDSSNAPELIVEKGLVGVSAICEASKYNFPVNISPDFRAMMCPERQHNIVKAAENLIERLNSLCPNCDTPDFVFDKNERGLPCEVCGAATEQVRFELAACAECEHTEKKRVANETASSFYCGICNP